MHVVFLQALSFQSFLFQLIFQILLIINIVFIIIGVVCGIALLLLLRLEGRKDKKNRTPIKEFFYEKRQKYFWHLKVSFRILLLLVTMFFVFKFIFGQHFFADNVLESVWYLIATPCAILAIVYATRDKTREIKNRQIDCFKESMRKIRLIILEDNDNDVIRGTLDVKDSHSGATFNRVRGDVKHQLKSDFCKEPHKKCPELCDCKNGACFELINYLYKENYLGDLKNEVCDKLSELEIKVKNEILLK